MKLDKFKRQLCSQYDFTAKKAFTAIDDWSYNYLDEQNLRRFLKKTGYQASGHDLISILRRFDIDGDAKINFKEFELGIKPRNEASPIPNKKPRTKSTTIAIAP